MINIIENIEYGINPMKINDQGYRFTCSFITH